jgi:hypothetical protein
VGTLGEVLKHAEPELSIYREGEIAEQYLVSLNGQEFVRNPQIPIGPGDRVIVMDSDGIG